MKRGLRIVALGGAVIVLVGVVTRGDFSFGFGEGPMAFAFHCGLVYLIVGALDLAIGDRVSGKSPFVVALVAIPILFVLSTGILYLDLFVVTPRLYSKPAISSILYDRLSFSLVVGAVGLGYPIGVRAEYGIRISLLVGTALWASSLVVSRTVIGTAPGFTEMFYLLLGIAAILGTTVLYLTVRFDFVSRILPSRVKV